MPRTRSLQEFGCEFPEQVLRREAAKNESRPSFGMAEVVESRWQIQIAHESTGSGARKIRKRDSILSGIRFVDKSKSQRMKGSDEWILAGRWPVSEIFMQNSAG